ncbi:fatty acid hydroxylase [Didymella exigua CBS 183.55]|uniref:Bifunctional cytochrome P450/NADPH--P450 reductase n=1 Tax=Didymella exigua CBS 183.55 TaxID=1150837 RepID=A0A6A5RQG0_9PLEO|nr:fatty acid hydroxylase [Didymella exigua CBS 183.55]KAF1929899.1 fatty acid hydroxylase [Didymella exigua CBS 183.55]
MEPIPSPHGYPIVGNVLDIDPEHPNESLAHIAAVHGPIFRLWLPAERIFVGNYALAKDLFDEKRFQKGVTGPLAQVRHATGDGLFTALPGEHNWEIAHRILMPAFGPLSIKAMFSEMQDVANQMVLRWARFGENVVINVADDFTRLTLDSIALCAMGDRFNSFYREQQHPFVDAMVGTLTESFARSRRLPLPALVYSTQDKMFQLDIEKLVQVSEELLNARRAHPTEKKDLLNAMLLGRDPKTGEGLDDGTIVRNMITFLIAGHETTSGMLSFLFYELLENPSAYRRAQEEVDTVIGKETITVDHMGKLPYLEACLRETLRLHPTAPAFTLQAKGDQVIGDRYTIKDKQHVTVILAQLHRDPEVYGTDAENFRPERMEGKAFSELPPNSWKPFGNGMRACIGRPFAWQEALLTVATLLQTFRFSKANPSYSLLIKTSLTIKPQDFYIKAHMRDPNFLQRVGFPSGDAGTRDPAPASASSKPRVEANDLRPLRILFGSNTGTCEAVAQALAESAVENGYKAEVQGLDAAVSSLSRDVPVVIITASYEGLPPDNATHFVEWLKSNPSEEVKDVRYAVFGLGNKEWYSTYQKIPTFVDDALFKNGAQRLTDRVALDVTSGNIFDFLDEWQESELWPKLGGKKNSAGAQNSSVRALPIEIDVQARSHFLKQDMQLAQVSGARLLTRPGAMRKRHIEMLLPSGTTYRAGDYIAVLPLNPPQVVQRVMKRFRLPWDTTITIKPEANTSLPVGRLLSIHDVLAGMVELGQPITSRSVNAVANSIADEKNKIALQDRFEKENFQKLNITLIDVLEDYPDAAFTIAEFLAAVTPMRVRQYSISSSPLEDAAKCSLTFSVLDASQKSGRKDARYFGACSTFLERLNVGDQLQISFRPSRSGFHLPQDDNLPLIMACAGTGLAPFRAFVAERAIKKRSGADVGPAMLFYGCNAPDEDDMYRDEFDAWEKQGVVSVRRAYTFKAEASENCKFVQERIWHDREEIKELFHKGASLFLCGAGVVGVGVEAAMAKIRADSRGETIEEATQWVKKVKGDRFWSDVFS